MDVVPPLVMVDGVMSEQARLARERFNAEQKRQEDSSLGNSTARVARSKAPDRAAGESGASGVSAEGTVQTAQVSLEEHVKAEVIRLRDKQTTVRIDIKKAQVLLEEVTHELHQAESREEVVNAPKNSR